MTNFKYIILGIILSFVVLSPGQVNSQSDGPPPAIYVDPFNSGGTNSGSITPGPSNPTYNVPVQGGRFTSIQDVGQWMIRFITIGLVPLMIGLALLVFLWGILKFIWKGSSEEEHTEGRKFMIWGLVGLFAMISVWGLVGIITGTLGETIGIPTLNRLR